MRKILSILLSFLFFPKPWSAKYAYGGLLFAASLLLSMADQSVKKRQKAMDQDQLRGSRQRVKA